MSTVGHSFDAERRLDVITGAFYIEATFYSEGALNQRP
jgi:hypothetical protein